MTIKEILGVLKLLMSILILITISLIISLTISTYIKFDKSDIKFIDRYLTSDPVKQIDISITNVPQSCIDALISTEDRYFYSNIGLDIYGVYRYFSSQINNSNLGGSSLSQQLIKNIDNSIYSNNLIDKYLESIKAIKLNVILKKNEILEEYFNNVYLGNFNYGIEAASINYFSKSAKFLNTKECTYLIGIINSPETLNPTVNLNKGIERSNVVLDLMLDNKYISDIEYSSLIKEPLNIRLINDI